MKKISENILALIAITIVFLVGAFLIYKTQQWSLFPTFLLTCITAIFSYLAYKHTLEKFRLELFDKRFEIYENLEKFCSSVARNGTLNHYENETENISQSKIEGIKAAHESFRGLGYHKYKMLFGRDIEKLMNELNETFGTLVLNGPSIQSPEYAKWCEDENAAIRLVLKTLETLPSHFKPYMYFGDYRSEIIPPAPKTTSPKTSKP